MSKAIILISFCFAALLISADYQATSLNNSAKAADSWDEEISEEENPRTDPSRPRLREGTRIASVVGRFTKVGRRWMFELEPTEEKATETESSELSQEKPHKKIASQDKDKDKDKDKDEAKPERPASKASEANPIRYRVLENLTLQRAVDAIAQDPNDVRWVASGTITEFDGENWLLLLTVFRAHSTVETVSSP